MMDIRQKRLVIVTAASLILASLCLAEAQQTTKTLPRIGFISSTGAPGSPSPLFDAFRQGLRDLGYVDATGTVKPPFVWDADDRAHRMARLDALFMHLYGLSELDADYILSTFPIVREKDQAAFGTFRTRDLILAYRQRIDGGVLSHGNLSHDNLA